MSSQTSDPASITASAEATDSTVAVDGAPPVAPSAAQRDSAAASSYRVLDELGRGGMGRVMRAEDVRLRREVAVKQLVSRSSAARARFEREAHITARLQHPAIVPVYEAHLDADGAPFYAMKLVTGKTLAEVIRSTSTLTDRMGLVRHVVAVADAMAYAHSRRVIHRDLKASNVVVGEFGETIVIDWGLAKDLTATDDPISAERDGAPGSGDLTQDGTVMGTPAYMPPEQAEGDPVDERADVYALGVMLYHVIAGEMPYSGASSADVLAAVLAGPPRPLIERVPSVPRDLAAIVAKAMAREPARRYPSARELAGELTRFQTGQLVGAHEYTTRELIARWVRRHRAAVVVGAVALAGATVGGGLAVRSVVLAGRQAEAARRVAVHERDEAESARRAAVLRADEAVINRARDLADDSPSESLRLLSELSPGTPLVGTARVIAADARAHGPARMIGRMSSHGRLVGVARDGVVLATSSDAVLWWRPDGRMAISAKDGPAVALDGSASAWLEDGAAWVSTVTPPEPRRVEVPDGTKALAVTPGGGALFALAGDHVFRVDVASGERRDLGIAPAGVFPPDLASEHWLFVAGGIARGENIVRRAWRADGREVIGPGVPLASSRDGSKTLFLDGRRLLVRSAGGDTFIATTTTGFVGGSFDDSGRWLSWTQHRDDRIHLHDLTSTRAFSLEAHSETAIARAFSPDGTLLATGGNDGLIEIWDLRVLADERPAELDPVGPSLTLDAGDTVIAMAFSGSGELVAVMEQGLVAMWELPPIAWTPRMTDVSYDLRWSGAVTDGVAYARKAGETEIHRLDGVTRRSSDPGNERIAFSRDGHVAAVAGVRDVVRWEPATGASQRHPLDADVLAVAITPSGDRIAAFTVDGALWILDGNGAPRRIAGGLTGVDSPELSPDGAHVALRGDPVTVVRVADGTSLTLAPGRYADFSPDGREAAITGGKIASRCELATARCEELKLSFDTAHAAFGPAGELAAVRRELEVVEWPKGKSAEEPAIVARHRSAVNEITYSPDGLSLGTTGQGPEVQLHDRASGEYRLLGGIHDHPTDVRFADGKVLVADWFRVYTFDDSLPRDEAALRAAIERR